MTKVIAIMMLVLTVLAFSAVTVSMNAAPVLAEGSCGGAGQMSCEDYCTYNPRAPECKNSD